MTTVTSAALRLWSRSLAETYEADAGRPSSQALALLATRLLRSTLTVVGRRSPEQTHAIRWWPRSLPLPRHDDAYESLVHLHPVRNAFRNSGEAGAYRLSDHQHLGDFRASGLYVDYFRHFEVTRLAAIYVPIAAGSHVSLGVSRDGGDFTDEEIALLSFLQPHLEAAVRREDARAAEARAPLTHRELEVLRWLREGKTNAEIAIILGCRPLTVKTHVERILAKTGAPNRTAAARLP